jgi:opacity protein-like surface antigen
VPARSGLRRSNPRSPLPAIRIAGICAAIFFLAVGLPDFASAQRVKLDYVTLEDRGDDILDDMYDALGKKCITKQEWAEFDQRVSRWLDQFNNLVRYDDELSTVVVDHEDPPDADATNPFRGLRYKKPDPFPIRGKPLTGFDILTKIKVGLLRDLEALRIKLEECDHPKTGYRGGGYFGIELAKTSARERKTETPLGSDDPTFRATDSGDPLGLGIVAGYNFRPWNSNIVVGPFASFDYLRQTINHNFAGGQFLGSTTKWFGNAGVKAGVVTAPGLYLYGLAGAAFVNHDLNVNFATAASSNVTTPGVTLGLGAEYQPPSWQLSGHPVSLFAQYQHTWWDNANFNRPASSPAFNYAFQREDDTVKFGVNFYFGAAAPAPPPAAPAYPVKAPASR